MKNLDALEKWVPRRPSRKLHARIFGQAAESDLVFHLRDLSRWVVPAFGCFLLVLGSLSNHLPGRFPFNLDRERFELPPLSEESAVALLPGVNHSGVNCYPARSMEFNFAPRGATVITAASSALISYTNKLMQ